MDQPLLIHDTAELIKWFDLFFRVKVVIERRSKASYRCSFLFIKCLQSIICVCFIHTPLHYPSTCSEWVNIGLRRFLHNHGNIATEGSPRSWLCPTLIEWIWGFFIVHSTIDSTVHSRPLNSFVEHCIYRTSIDDKYLTRPGFEHGTS